MSNKAKYSSLNDNEPEVTPEQEELYFKIDSIYNAFIKEIAKRRIVALDFVKDSSNSSEEKKIELQTYFEYRMNLKDHIIELQDGIKYSGQDLFSAADQLYNDPTFYYSDNDVIKNCFSLFEDSLTFEDEVLAVHYDRLAGSPQSLTVAVAILSNYLSSAIEINFKSPAYTSCANSDYECSKALLKKLVESVYQYLSLYFPQIRNNRTDFYLEKDSKLSYFSYQDELAYRDISVDTTPDRFAAKRGIPEIKLTNEEIKEKQAGYAKIDIARSVHSIYLLLRFAELYHSDCFDEHELKKYRATFRRICDNIFISNYSAYEMITDNKETDFKGISIQEGKIDNFKVAEQNNYLQMILISLTGLNDTNDILKKRRVIFADAKNSFPEDSEFWERISKNISKRLTETQSDISVSDKKNDVRKLLGSKSTVLSDNTLNTLASAEILFDKYCVDVQDDDFDFSGISAMYYQSFENAYNELIWTPYAEILNSKCFSTTNEFKYYLIPNNVHFYGETHYDKKNKVTIVKGINKWCMYGNFKYLIDDLKNGRNGLMREFHNFYSRIAGFTSREAMYHDQKYMRALADFYIKLDSATENRNNASHGEKRISNVQCQVDKLTIMETRNNNIGLIRLLIELVKYH